MYIPDIHINCKVSFSWWVIPYLHVCLALTRVMPIQWDIDKIVERIVRHGTNIEMGKINE